MSPVLRSYVIGGLIFAVSVGCLTSAISYLGTKYVDRVISEKLDAREAGEHEAEKLFRKIGKNFDEKDLETLASYASSGSPKTNSMLAWVYEARGLTERRDKLVMDAMDRMNDPDLLLFLAFMARIFDPEAQLEAFDKIKNSSDSVSRKVIYASMLSFLPDADVSRLQSCYARLQKTYTNHVSGPIAIRYAYFNDTMSCQTHKGTHDADQAGS